MRIKLTFSYDGSKFMGFQRQNNGRTVQKTIEQALSKIYQKDVLIKGAGRTDAGVHACGQVAHFDTDIKIDNLKKKMNELLPYDIRIINVKYVDDKFNARSSAIKKEYIYKINLGAFKSSLNNYYYQPNFKLDISSMKDASHLFIGTHDFHNFVAGTRDSYISTINSITFSKFNNKLEISFIGRGFYRYMVRNLVGALLEVGEYRIARNVIEKMLNNPDIKKSLPTAKPEGLYLNKIWY